MNFLDARFRIQHPCPFCDFSAAFPEVEMTLWCNGSNEVLQITVPQSSQLPEVLRVGKRRLNAREMIQDSRSALAMTRICGCRRYRSVSSIAEKCGLWIVPPVTFHGGWETHRVISAGKAALRRFVNEVSRIGKVEMLSYQPRDRLDVLQDTAVVPVHFFESLTGRQIHALVSAYENGLLDVPARNRMGEVARHEGLSRSTFGEHLRKAQQQLLRNSYPFLKLRDVDASPKRRKGVSHPAPRGT